MLSVKPFCEIIVKNILPTIRAMLAARLSEKGLSGKEIAERMNVTPAAVTQYLHKARGSEELDNRVVNEKIDQLANLLLKDELDEGQLMERFCELCKTVREQGLICELHKKSAKLHDCSRCLPCP